MLCRFPHTGHSLLVLRLRRVTPINSVAAPCVPLLSLVFHKDYLLVVACLSCVCCFPQVAPTGQEDSFPSWEGDGEDGLVDTGDPVTDDNDNANEGGDKDGKEQQQAEKQSPGGVAAATVAPPAGHAGDGDGVGSNGAEHKAEEVRSDDDWRKDAPVCWGHQSGRFRVLPTEPQHQKGARFLK